MITRKAFLNLGVLVLTFLIGCLMHDSLQRSRTTEDETLRDWKRITIGRVSFLVPPEMKAAERYGDDAVLLRPNSDDSQFFSIYYAYGSRIETDVNATPTHLEQVTISGKPALINEKASREQQWCAFDPAWMQLVVTDVGNGNKFELFASTTDFAAARKVIDTIEIH